MNAPIQIATPVKNEAALLWLARVLTGFAQAEQALGRLCLEVGLSIEKGSLSNLEALRKRLQTVDCRRCAALDKRIGRWCAHRGERHLLAHGTLSQLFDEQGRAIVVAHHLPRDHQDITHDRMWTEEERNELLRIATSDGRSISDQVRNLLADKTTLSRLRTP